MWSWMLRTVPVGTVKFSPNGKWMGAGWYGGYVALWTGVGTPHLGFKASNKHVTSITFTPDGSMMATCGLGGLIRIWNPETGEQIGEMDGHQTAVGSLKFLADGQTLASFGYSGKFCMWDALAGEPCQSFPVIGDDVRGVVVSPDETVAAIPMRRQVELRSMENWSVISVIPVGSRVVNSVAFSPDGKTLVTSGGNGVLQVFR